MKSDNRQLKIAIVGACWIVSGVISVLIDAYLISGSFCACPMIIVDGSQVPCSCPISNGALINACVGVAAILLGTAIIAARGRIEKLSKSARK